MPNEYLTLPRAFEVTMPPDLTDREWIEVEQCVDVETMWERPVSGKRYTAILSVGSHDTEIATRQRFSVRGEALGNHPELGLVSIVDRVATTRVHVILAFTPWVVV